MLISLLLLTSPQALAGEDTGPLWAAPDKFWVLAKKTYRSKTCTPKGSQTPHVFECSVVLDNATSCEEGFQALKEKDCHQDYYVNHQSQREAEFVKFKSEICVGHF